MERRTVSFSPPDISELEIQEVVESLRSGWITTGPRTKLLENRLSAFIDSGQVNLDCESSSSPKGPCHRVACLNSATAAEEFNLRLLGIGEGDEVIVPAYTYTATASAAIHCGAKVVFVDIKKDGDLDTHLPEMDPDRLASAITDRTRAVVCVDIGGVVCDYQKVFEIVREKSATYTPKPSDGSLLSEVSSRIQQSIGRIAVVSDSAHSLGASRLFNGEKVCCGKIADFTSFSFHAVKNLTTAEGGASTWLPLSNVSDEEIYKVFQLLSLHGQNKDAFSKNQAGSWEYDIIGPWYKCNMTDVLAAIGLRQLDRYPSLIRRRKEIVEQYSKACDELGLSYLIHHTPNMESSNHLFLVRVPNASERIRNDIINNMAKKGVAANVHYKPLPMMTAYGANCEDYPNAFDYYKNLISLPLHTLLSDEDVAYVCDVLKQAIQEEMDNRGC